MLSSTLLSGERCMQTPRQAALALSEMISVGPRTESESAACLLPPWVSSTALLHPQNEPEHLCSSFQFSFSLLGPVTDFRPWIIPRAVCAWKDSGREIAYEALEGHGHAKAPGEIRFRETGDRSSPSRRGGRPPVVVRGGFREGSLHKGVSGVWGDPKG